MLQVTIREKTGEFAAGTKVSEVVRTLLPAQEAEQVLGVMRGGVCLEMDEALTKAAHNDGESIDKLYEVATRFLSYNKTGRMLSQEYVEKMLDIGDIVVFFKAYANFIAELKSGKN